MISPRIGGGFVGDLGGFEGDGRIAGTIHPFRALQSDAQAPVGIIAKGKNKNGVVSRLRRGRTGWELLCGWRILAPGEYREGGKEQRQEQSASGHLRHANGGLHGQ